MNKTGKGYFKPGNNLSKGRPKKNDVIKSLELLREDVNNFPTELLKAIAEFKTVTLQDLKIPIQQVTEQARVIAAGLVYLREQAGDND